MSLNSERLRKAKILFDEGKIREADAILKVEEMTREGDQLLTQKARELRQLQVTDSLLRITADEFLVKAQTRAVNYDIPSRYDSAAIFFQQSIQYFKNWENLGEYAYFLQSNNQLDSAIYYYNQSLALIEIKDTSNLYIKANIYNNLGILYNDKNDYVNTETAHLKALEIRKQLVDLNPQAHEHRLAQSYNNIGNMYGKRKAFYKAEEAFLKAMETQRKLIKDNSQVNQYELAISLSNLGILYRDKFDYDKAEAFDKEALEILKQLVKTNPQTYEQDLAKVQMNIGFPHQN